MDTREPVLVWGQRGSSDGEFLIPYSIAIGEDSVVYIADSGNHRIQCFRLSDGTFLRSIEVLANFPPGLLPVCVNYLGTERIYVTDYYNHRVQVFDPKTGKFVHAWGKRGSEAGEFLHPLVCTVNTRDGSIHVLDWGPSTHSIFYP